MKPVGLRRPLPRHTWIGLAGLALGEIAILSGVEVVSVWFTPIQWTGYILLADGLVYARCGTSWLTSRRREFPFLALASIGIWLVFEVYNFHLRNWIYQGVPSNPWLRGLAYGWSFATILPGVFETADLIHAAVGGERASLFIPGRAEPIPRPGLWFALGLMLITVPLLVPSGTAAYLFGMVWLGFIPLLEAVNPRLRSASFASSWRDGGRERCLALLAAGMACGLLWEAWNYQAYLAGGGHWIYTVPDPLRLFGLHFGRMPVLGLLGFPPFAVELYLLYALLRERVGGDRVLSGIAGLSSSPM